ncbi:Major facilitator superfamily domain, general substrate transporter [Metarhizium album ARSEF 1941]|uniref:Major facilitator superfamily domain, general substrate transporter n=1 Tax=Metarhizium album (strain ARSEF 1941) TaxID=1081103 RepID=A0A0B2WZD3_METAS|nr:Major facilitator superfamily domain, general substrate transporter [Metarhizium album ARSEF 1941]KHN98939.1 Major facilitator superfamily domain, general substrate transporter [Metarhizium album ARSEF 1941]
MAVLTRIFSRPVNKPYRTRDLDLAEPPFLDGQGLLAFKPHDIENPQNWSTARRVTVTICAVMLVMNATFASSAPSGCIPSIAEDFGISIEAASLTITLFLLGYCAGPLLFAPLSELYGRRWVFYITFTMYIAFNFLCAFAPNFGSLLAGRFLTGTLVSAPLSNAPGVLADIWRPLERANAMALFSTMVWIGPALGPVVAGFLELKKDWHWAFYVLIWLGAGTWLIMLTIPETHAPTILLHKAKRIRKARIPGYEEVKAPAEMQDRSIRSVFGVALTRPWIILFDPISLLCAIYLAVVYTLLYMLFSIYPIVFQERRGWNSGVGELPLIGTVVGAVLGGSIVLLDTRRRSNKTKKGEAKAEDMEPEDRLPLAMVGGVGFAAAMFWFAWTAEFNSVHWIVPTIAGSLLSTFMLLIFVAYLNYLVDVYLVYAASAIAANTIARSACGAAAPLFTRQMFHALGVGGGGSLVAGVATLLAVVPFIFYKYGRPIRLRSKFAPTNAKEENRVTDEEASPGDFALQSPSDVNSSTDVGGSTQALSARSEKTEERDLSGGDGISASDERKESGTKRLAHES